MIRAPGLVLGERYRLVRRIAIGGMGEVWVAADQALEREVAVKVLREEYAGNEDFLARLRTEARNSAALSHPNIAQMYDYGEQSGSGYLVMELVIGEPLADLLEREPIVPLPKLMPILSQTARALHAAHMAGVVHRDVKPGNILIDRSGEVKITDFGVSLATNQVPMTATGMVMGTAQYLSPEQAIGDAATGASDIYALGIVAYESVVGHRPFTGTTPVDIAVAHVNDPVPPMPGNIDAELSGLIMAMLAKDPALRPRPAGALARMFDEIAARVAADPWGGRFGTTDSRRGRRFEPVAEVSGVSREPNGAAAGAAAHGTAAHDGTAHGFGHPSPGHDAAQHARIPEPVAPIISPIIIPAEIRLRGHHGSDSGEPGHAAQAALLHNTLDTAPGRPPAPDAGHNPHSGYDGPQHPAAHSGEQVEHHNPHTTAQSQSQFAALPWERPGVGPGADVTINRPAQTRSRRPAQPNPRTGDTRLGATPGSGQPFPGMPDAAPGLVEARYPSGPTPAAEPTHGEVGHFPGQPAPGGTSGFADHTGPVMADSGRYARGAQTPSDVARYPDDSPGRPALSTRAELRRSESRAAASRAVTGRRTESGGRGLPRGILISLATLIVLLVVLAMVMFNNRGKSESRGPEPAVVAFGGELVTPSKPPADVRCTANVRQVPTTLKDK